jgi:hypothetical protein
MYRYTPEHVVAITEAWRAATAVGLYKLSAVSAVDP